MNQENAGGPLAQAPIAPIENQQANELDRQRNTTRLPFGDLMDTNTFVCETSDSENAPAWTMENDHNYLRRDVVADRSFEENADNEEKENEDPNEEIVEYEVATAEELEEYEIEVVEPPRTERSAEEISRIRSYFGTGALTWEFLSE